MASKNEKTDELEESLETLEKAGKLIIQAVPELRRLIEKRVKNGGATEKPEAE